MLKRQKVCLFCDNPFFEAEDYEVEDHCHMTGKYRGAEHTLFTLNAKPRYSSFIPKAMNNINMT